MSNNMPTTTARRSHQVSEDKRIRIIELRGKGYLHKDIAEETKTNIQTVRNVLNKWARHHTIRDLPKPGRPSKLDSSTKRRLARMAQSGEVSSSTDLVQTAASHDIAQISARTARCTLHQEGLKAMHMVGRPLLTRAHKRRRLEFARAHRDWTVD
ncbi:hypothetical protein EON65_55245, partial [archaeon]